MTAIRHDYANKQWLTRCPDEAAEPFALTMVCAVVCGVLWLYDISSGITP